MSHLPVCYSAVARRVRNFARPKPGHSAWPALLLALLGFALVPSGAQGQVSMLGSPVTSTETSGSQFSKTMAYTVPAGNNRLLVVTTGGGGNAASVSSVTFGGTPLTLAVTTAVGTTRSSIWYLVMGSSATGNSANVVVNYNATFMFDVTALALQGVDQAAPVSGAVSNSAGSLTVASAINDLVIDAIAGSGAGVAVGAGQTLRANNNNLIFSGDPDTGTSTEPGAAFVSMDWTGFVSGIAHVAVNIRQVPTAPVTISTATLPNATTNTTGYLEVLSATGGTGAKTFAVTAGALPPGLSLTAGGTVNGAPTTAGSFTFTITATDAVGGTGSRAFTILIAGQPTVGTPTFAALTSTTVTLGGDVTATNGAAIVTRGVLFSPTLTNSAPAFGGAGVVAASAAGAGTGVFTVNLTELTPATAYSFRAYATNSTGVGYSAISIFTTPATVAPIVISPTTLPNTVVDAAGYNQTLTATGGTGTLLFSIVNGSLPPGMNINAGTISGTPTTAGSYTFTVSARDNSGNFVLQSFTIVVSPPAAPLAIATTTLPNPVLNAPGYSQTIAVTGGTGTTTFNVIAGALPPGLSINLAGTISGTATTAGTYSFTVAAIDTAATVVSRAFTVVVAAPTPLAVTTTSLPNATVGVAYSQAVAATGGSGVYTFVASGGTLPPGLTLTGGTIAGTPGPTALGTFNFTVVVTDSLGAVASAALQIIAGPAALPPQTITFGPLANKLTTDAPITLSATASSGQPVSFAVTGPATLSGTTLTLTGQPGVVTVTASRAAGAGFAAAADVVRTFTVTAAPVAAADRLINLSARVRIAPDPARSLIAGFVIGGKQPKRVLVRGIGPTLATFGVGDALVNPRLQIFDASGAVVLENDDWSGAATSAAFAQVSAFALPAGSRDAALLATLAPGSYTMQITAGTETGTALAEVYDASLDPGAESQRLVNISTRGMVEAGDGVLIGGFVVRGTTPKRVLVRGIGPRLAGFGVTGALADPRLAVYSGQTVVAQNDNWSTPTPVGAGQTPATAAELATVAQAVGAFALGAGSLDAAVVVTLAPGAYTAQVAGTGTSTGVALVEIYEAP